MKADVVVDEIIRIEKLVAYVESETTEGIYYKVTKENEVWTCTCPDHRHRQRYCKHIEAAKIKYNVRLKENTPIR